MPAVKQVIDGLWNCLCPSSHVLEPSVLRVVFRSRPRVLKQCLIIQRQNNIRTFTKDPRAAQRCNARRLYVCAPRYAHQKAVLSAVELRDQGFMRELDIQTAYQRLRQIASGGNHSQIQACVNIMVTERCQKPNVRLYDALLLANVDHEYGSASETSNLLEEMANEGISPDSATYHAVLKARNVLAVHPDYLLRHHILDELRQRWFTLTRDGWHDLAAGFIRDRQLELAFDTLKQMRKEGARIESWLYDMMVYTLCTAEEFDSVLELMEYRLSGGELTISATLWYHLLDTASRALHHAATLFAYRARVESLYLNPPAGLCVNILSTAARHGDTYLATSVLRILGRRSGNPIQLHHYEALLETYIANNDLRTAFTLLTIMAAAGQPPIEASTRSIYAYLGRSPSYPAKAITILKDLHEEDRQIPIQAVNVVMQASILHRNLPSALHLYKTLHTLAPDLQPDTATFNILFKGCAQAARKDLAMFLASEMAALKVTPDALTYDRLILVCLNSEDRLEDAWCYFEEMRSLSWWPRDGTIVVLARRGCEQSDRRVWNLERNAKGKGLSSLRLQTLVREYWQGGAEEAEKELNRSR